MTLAILFSLAVVAGHGGIVFAETATREAYVVPADSGRVGAFRVLSFDSLKVSPKATIEVPPADVSEREILVSEAHPPGIEWTTELASSGPVTVEGDALLRYFAMTPVADEELDASLLLGCEGAFSVFWDGVSIFSRKAKKGFREDDVLLPVHLTKGKHRLVVKSIRNAKASSSVLARFVDGTFARPKGLRIVFPEASLEGLFRAQLEAKITKDGYHYAIRLDAPNGHPDQTLVRPEISAFLGDLLIFRALGGDIGRGDRTRFYLPPLGLAPEWESKGGRIDLRLHDRTFSFPVRPNAAMREAAFRAETILTSDKPLADRDSLAHLKDRAIALLESQDPDRETMDKEALSLRTLVDALATDPDAASKIPLANRRAYRSPLDGSLQEFGLYVPQSYLRNPAKSYPLVVALHGLNGRPMAMLRWFFGGDDKDKDQVWEDRHWGALPELDAFVVSPNGFGNAMYRYAGEEDVYAVIDWVRTRYPIDPKKISITGPSMGGIGTAAIAFHRPDLFSSAAPLCGYHSYSIRGDVVGAFLRPWERFLVEERSNVEWAENGSKIPLYIVHGTQDLPETNSGVLIEKYEKLGFKVQHEHPNLGHNVWQTTYEDLKGAKWLVGNTRRAPMDHVRFRSARPRFNRTSWITITRFEASDRWAEVEGDRLANGNFEFRISGATAFELERKKPGAAVVRFGSTRLSYAPDEALAAHLEGSLWKKGPPREIGYAKIPGLSGPIRDIYHDPIRVIYGASIPAFATVHEELAHFWAKGRLGFGMRYPVESDTTWLANGGRFLSDVSYILIGRASTNRALAKLEDRLPIKVVGDEIVVDDRKFGGRELGAAFIAPNPENPAKYVVVIEGVDPTGAFLSLSLPDLLPDYAIYNHSVMAARGGTVLGEGSVLAAGFFGNDWQPQRPPRRPLTR